MKKNGHTLLGGRIKVVADVRTVSILLWLPDHCFLIAITKNKLVLTVNIPSEVTFFHGFGGYMKAAFWIWSWMSSSSLNGNVPLRLT